MSNDLTCMWFVRYSEAIDSLHPQDGIEALSGTSAPSVVFSAEIA